LLFFTLYRITFLQPCTPTTKFRSRVGACVRA
jgi:hypothetical protein